MAKSLEASWGDERVGIASILSRLLAACLIIAILAAGFFIVRYGDEKNELFGAAVVLAAFGAIGFFYLICTCFGVCRLTMSPLRYAGLVKIFDQMEQAIVITDQEESIRYMNHRYRQLSQGKKRRPEMLFSRDEKSARTMAKLSRAARQGSLVYGELYLPHPVANESTHSDLAPIYDVKISTIEVAGEALHIWLIDDITARRQHQERQFADLAQAIDHLDHAPAGFVAWDRTGKITYLNAALANWIGFDLAIQAPEKLSLSRLVGAQAANDLQQFLQKKHVSSVPTCLDLDLFHESGKRMPVNFHLVAVNEGDDIAGRGVLTRHFASHDLSQSDVVLRQGRGASSDFGDYFHFCPIALAVLDKQGLTRSYNPCFGTLLGLQDQETKVEIGQLLMREDAQRLIHFLDQADRSGEISFFDGTISSHDEAAQKSRHIRLFIRRLNNAEPFFIMAIVEIDEQRALEEYMEQGQKMQAVGQLAGGIAHDFNNVLTAIIMSCDLLLSNHRSSDPSHPDIMNIKHNADRAATLVRHLLAFSRRQTLRPEVLDVSDMLADLRLLLTRLVGMNIQVQIEHGRDLWPIKADRSELEHALINLASNARDAMPDGGTLTIRSANVETSSLEGSVAAQLKEGDYILVEVRDSGVGMSASIREKIFEPFFTTKEVGKGTGLGLSMVYGMINQTGGHIHCESAVGFGTCFSLYLPRHMPAGAAEEDHAWLDHDPLPLRDLSGTATILLVEDEDAVRLGSVRALQSRGYTVLEASSGVGALEIVSQAQGRIDLIVSDVVMPEMDGPTLLKELRASYPQIKFIFVSGYAEDAFAKNLPEDAHFAFLPKPFSLKQLAEKVKEMLE